MGEPVRIVDLVAQLRAPARRPRRPYPVHRAAARREAPRGALRRRRGRVPTAHPRIFRRRRRPRARGLPAADARAVRRGGRNRPTRCVAHLRAAAAGSTAPTARARAGDATRALPRRLLMRPPAPTPKTGRPHDDQRHRGSRRRATGGSTTGHHGARVFDSDHVPADRDLVASLSSRRRSGMDLAAPPVVLPDFHHKSKMEMPSSIAVATTRHDPARRSPARRSTAGWR